MSFMNTTLRAAAILPTILLTACGGEAGLEELQSSSSALSADTKIFVNFYGDTRYVKANEREVKLFMDPSYTNPRSGFKNTNHFDNSCGPTAALNVFKWYGIDKLEGRQCAMDTSNPPKLVCQDRMNADELGRQMQTNKWKFLGFTMPGTNTANFRGPFKTYLQKWSPTAFEFKYAFEEGDGLTQYRILWATLAQGHPIVVNYKTGTTKGHFATIVGMEKVGLDDDIGNDKVYLANARKEDLGDSISYAKFRELWRRDYSDFGSLALIGERRYTHMNLWTKGAPSPISGGGGGTDPSDPPIFEK